MTDQEDTAAPGDAPQGHPDLPKYPSDWALNYLVESVAGDDDNSTSTLWVTVTVRGSVVTGELVSPLRWLEGLAAQQRPSGPELADSIEQSFGALMKKAVEERTEMAEQLPRSFIHFRDARIVHGAVTLKVGMWRARLHEVDGWTLGRLGED